MSEDAIFINFRRAMRKGGENTEEKREKRQINQNPFCLKIGETKGWIKGSNLLE